MFLYSLPQKLGQSNILKTKTNIAVSFSLVLCGIYYYLWIYVIPRWRGYRIRQETVIFEDGANAHKLTQVPIEKVDEWDRNHDPLGRHISPNSGLQHSASDSDNGAGVNTVITEPKV